MSFSHEQKSFIISGVYKSLCCRRSLLMGALFAKGEVTLGRVSLRLEKQDYAEFLSSLILEIYGKCADLSRPSGGGRVVVITFESKSAANYISNFQNKPLGEGFKCPSCQSAFLRGVFLAAGRTCNPEKEYFVEYSLAERSTVLFEYLKALGITGRITKKKTGDALYFKDGATIEDLFARSGLNGAVFKLIDARFSREERKNVMRITNCETNNLQRTVNAAAKQTQLISELADAGLLSTLPEELEITAKLRLAYPDYSLSQLSMVSVPRVSKPGLSHRLKKICEIANQLLHKDE
jgi:DNA-binding transcriptional regulator WhiA